MTPANPQAQDSPPASARDDVADLVFELSEIAQQIRMRVANGESFTADPHTIFQAAAALEALREAEATYAQEIDHFIKRAETAETRARQRLSRTRASLGATRPATWPKWSRTS